METNDSKLFLEKVIARKEPESTVFYEKYDLLIWDIAQKWYGSIGTLSKKQYELEDLHNELWAHIYKNIKKCDTNRADISTWIYIVSESKCGMIKRSLETKKNSILSNELNYPLITNPMDNEESVEILNLIGEECNIEDIVGFQEFLLDYIYSVLELVDSCTDKERKVYLLRIKGKNQNEIAEEVDVSKSYIPKIYKRLNKKFKHLYDTLYEQQYIDKKERDELSKDLLSKKPEEYICKKYDLEKETVRICNEMLAAVGI